MKLKGISYTVLYEEKNEISKNKRLNNDDRISCNERIDVKKMLNDIDSDDINNNEEIDNNFQFTKAVTIKEKDLTELVNNNKLLTVTFIAEGNKILMPMTCKNNTTFKNYEEKLFEQYPEYNNNNTVFMVNGDIINRKSTLEENKIKNKDTILIMKTE